MAGFYADVPGPRIPYDRNGSTLFYTVPSTGAIGAWSSADVRILNDEGQDTHSLGPVGIDPFGYFGVIFPSACDLTGYWLAASSPVVLGTLDFQDFSYSNDTTNGVDGTWTTIGTGVLTYDDFSPTGPPIPQPIYRSNIQSLSLTCTAIRTSAWGNPHSAAGASGWVPWKFHVYGTRTGPADRLDIWDPSSNVAVGGAYFDWGDVAAPSGDTRTFRVKNQSALTATSITVGMEALTDDTPSVLGMHDLSADGTTFTPSLNIGNLAPGAISGVLTLRRGTPLGAPAGVWAQRIVASAASFV